MALFEKFDAKAALRRIRNEGEEPTKADDGKSPAVYAAMDAERNERDRQAHRGYDHDATAPSHNEYVGRTPAGTLIRTCLEYGVGLRVEPDGTLVVASNGKAWRSLIDAIEAHVDEIAVLILNKWSPYDA